MKRIIILLFTLYFSAICIQQHTAAQPIPGPMVPVPGPMVPGTGPVVPGQVVPVPGPAIPVPTPVPAPGGDYFRQDGVASWYGYEFDGRPTASGEIYNSSLFTAAHPTLPFGTILMVTNRQNNRQVAVKVNDRGPFVGGRIIDLSRAAAEQLDMLITGTAPVSIDKIQPNHPLYATPSLYLQPQLFQQPPGYLSAPGYLPPQAFQPPPGYLPPQQAPMVVTQPMLPPPQRLPPPLPQQQIQGPMTPILIPTPPPVPETPPPAAPSSITVQVFPSNQTTTITPNPADFPGGPRARLNPSITPLPDRIYKLQVGSYRIAGNAVDAYVKLKAVGLEPSYERNGDYFRVVLANVRGTNVISVMDKLGTAGFREAIIREER
jgi:rare lipoprotein A